MRGLWSTVALIVVLAGLSAYIYFVTSKQPENDGGLKQDKVFASVQADKIDDLRIKAESGDATALTASIVTSTAGPAFRITASRTAGLSKLRSG